MALFDTICQMMRKNTMSRILFSILFAALFAMGPWIAEFAKPLVEMRYPDEFRIDKIAMNRTEGLPEFPLPDLEFLESKKFSYLGHGGQSIAFVSDDKQYVLKFFLEKQIHGPKRYPIPKPTHFFPSHREKRRKRREKKRFFSLLKTMKNYATAYEKIPECTGILALHLNATEDPLPSITVKDFKGNSHTVDLAKASFVLQKKADLVLEKLEQAASEEEKRSLLFSLEELFKKRARNGFIDIERSFMIEANYGFLGSEPIQFDVGNIVYLQEQKESPELEIQKNHGLLHAWERSRGLR